MKYLNYLLTVEFNTCEEKLDEYFVAITIVCKIGHIFLIEGTNIKYTLKMSTYGCNIAVFYAFVSLISLSEPYKCTDNFDVTVNNVHYHKNGKIVIIPL